MHRLATCLWACLLSANFLVNMCAYGMNAGRGVLDNHAVALIDVTFYSHVQLDQNEYALNRTFNAVKSWSKLTDTRNIILLADDKLTCEALHDEGLNDIQCVVHQCNHAVMVDHVDISCTTRLAVSLARTDIVCLVNSDIVFLSDFLIAVTSLMTSAPRETLIVGRRIDVELTERINENVPGWDASMRSYAEKHGKLHGEYGIDYFVHRKSFFEMIKLPAFVVGLWRWDNYLLAHALLHPEIYVVDATNAINAIHMGVNRQGDRVDHTQRPGAKYADDLATNTSNFFYKIGNENFQYLMTFSIRNISIFHHPCTPPRKSSHRKNKLGRCSIYC